MNIKIGEKIKLLRKQKNITQEVLAQYLGVSFQSVSKWENDPAKSEAILREGLKKFPGNDILLNNLLYTMRSPERAAEVITLCKSLVESTKLDDVKYDALRILAETYHEQGEQELTRITLEKIPEIYFTVLELQAKLLSGTESLRAANTQLGISLDSAVEMAELLASYYEAEKDTVKADHYRSIAASALESANLLNSMM